MTNIHDAYFAGLFDGEGGISIIAASRKNGMYYALKVLVDMVDKPVIDALIERFGGYIYIRPPEKPGYMLQYCWRLNGLAAKPFLEAIRPYCIAKASQIELALNFLETVSPKTTCVYQTESTKEIRAELCMKMRQLNIKSPYKEIS